MTSSDEHEDILIEVDHDPPQCSADSGLTDMEFVEFMLVEELRSIETRITQYKWENGRRYHAYREGPSHDFAVVGWTTALISATAGATDIGCWYRNWHMGDGYGVPPNCYFEVDDAESTWVRDPDSFDFVHVRFMWAGIRDYPKLVRQAMK
ncbi:hypothetical protein GP486_001577 [Trichoglossum hirsutum]|uniref:Uncharacterized protein n=1 Tax=Trichoglossum hirsutum TaxID=265104 RepID=A0A9P8LGM6_9PEZI|nr:hypothetical protein GP486_001577 [Trichoglossum hirsutum]